ncbi:MAG: hypothetical protein KDK51_02570 [Deltaproteobacteria bacterium]|nr:hypothetical protein [Deltaproteobacteria bacterium]
MYNIRTILLLLGALAMMLTSCGPSSRVGGGNEVAIKAESTNIKVMHYQAIVQQLEDVFGLDENSDAREYLDDNQALFADVNNNTITRRNSTYKLYIEACRESDALDSSILFASPDTPKIADIWDKFQPGDSVPEEIASSAREVEAITFESTSQLRIGLCLLASTALCNTTQNIPCHAESL